MAIPEDKLIRRRAWDGARAVYDDEATPEARARE